MVKPLIAHNEDNIEVETDVQSKRTSPSTILSRHNILRGRGAWTHSPFLPIPEQLSLVAWSYGHHDVYKGVLNGSAVAVKVFRIADKHRDAEECLKRLQREAGVWGRLTHPNLLPFLGFCNITPSDIVPSLVFSWMTQGNLNHYLRLFPDVDRLKLMISVGDALEYLHGNHVVHGNVHVGNILIDASGRAILSDYGVSQIYEASWSTIVEDLSYIRNQAPELISGEISTPTSACDVYSFGVVCYQVSSETQPFSNLGSAVDVILAVYEGQPPFPNADKRIFDNIRIDKAFWDLMASCWAGTAGQRPEIRQVLDGLIHCSQSSKVISRESHL